MGSASSTSKAQISEFGTEIIASLELVKEGIVLKAPWGAVLARAFLS